LWSGLASSEQAGQMADKLSLFERPGGLSMSDTRTGLQWDEPFGWAPTNWIAVAGLDAAGFHKDAERIARAFTSTVDAGFSIDGTIREKYNVVSSNAEVQVDTGYKVNVTGFGWTNGVYLKMRELLQMPVSISPNQSSGAAESVKLFEP
jgi:alpha,alpha-trehalase